MLDAFFNLLSVSVYKKAFSLHSMCESAVFPVKRSVGTAIQFVVNCCLVPVSVGCHRLLVVLKHHPLPSFVPVDVVCG